jgi:glutathione S-transferase
MLEEVGEPYDTAILGYGGDMKKADYLAINPMGKVPAIVHAGKVVTECAAICAYLADAFPAARLAPATTERADYYRWLFFAAGPVEQAVTNKSFGFELDPDKGGMAGYGSFDLAIDTLEKAVQGDGWICGDQFTAADVYVGSQIDWGLNFGTIEARPAFTDYAARLRQRPAYQRQKDIDNALMAQMKAQQPA